MTTTKPRIEKAYIEYKQDDMWTLDSFKKAIEDNLPPQIPVEAVEQLREKYTDTMKDFQDIYINGNSSMYGVWRAYELVIQDLDALLPKQTDGN